MKFSIFADLHYYPGAFLKGTLEDLRLIQERAEREQVDFMIHAGDLCHGPSKMPEIVKRYNEFHIPSYHCLGNHDTDNTSREETLSMYNMKEGHYYFDEKGYRFIICDPNYCLIDGEYVPYSLGNYYGLAWEQIDHMPPEQIAWLETAIAESDWPCVLISHQSLERDVMLPGAGVVKEVQEVRRVINEANRRKPHSVLMCINGHLHRDFIRILDNVCYFELNSTSYDWLNEPHDRYPEELRKQYRLLKHTVLFNDPVHAIISLDGTTIDIEGMESDMFMGVRTEDTGNNPLWDKAGRAFTPKVQSARFTLE